MAAVYLSSITISAYLSSTWVDISAYQFGRISAKWGSQKNGPIDFLADTGQLIFELRSPNSRFMPIVGIYPDWKKGCKVKLSIGFDGITRVFYGAIDAIIPNSDVVRETETVRVVVVDWMDRAAKYPLDYPDILLEKTADQVVQAVLNAIPVQPLEQSFATGATTFPVVFDTVTDFTKARTEFSKVLLSELCYMYVRHGGSIGEKLVLENRNSRVTPIQKTIPTYSTTAGFLLMETSDFLLLETGDRIILDLASSFSFTDEEIVQYQATYGDNVINDIRFHYIPKIYTQIAGNPGLYYPYVSSAVLKYDSTQEILQDHIDPGETKTILAEWGNYNFTQYNGGSYGANFRNQGVKKLLISQPFPSGLYATSQMFDKANPFDIGVTDITASLQVISFTAWMDKFKLVIKNNNVAIGYLALIIAGSYDTALIVCEPDTLSTVLQDVTSIAANDYQPIQWDMPYQITSNVGDTFAAAILAAEKDPRIVLNKISFVANSRSDFMIAFMVLDIGDYFYATSGSVFVDAYYFIQGFSFDIDPGGIVNVEIFTKEA